jgi:acetoin utilization deacetylase AcuC-like enzyme
MFAKGSRRARLAGSVHRDDRHLDPGTGKLVTNFLKLKHDGYRLQIHVRDGQAPDDWRKALLQAPGAR